MSKPSRVRRTVAIRSRNKGIRRALRATVVARRTASRRVVSSCPQVTGKGRRSRSPAGPVSSSTNARTRSSCSGLRTRKYPDTANASTRSRRARIAARAAASSKGATQLPAPSWPPCRYTTSSVARTRPKPNFSINARSYPIKSRHTALPCPSTMAFVASVVDNPTRRMSAGVTGSSPASDASKTAAAARPMPSARSRRVVNDLVPASTAPVAWSTSTASVKVPPVSIPKAIVIVSLLLSSRPVSMHKGSILARLACGVQRDSVKGHSDSTQNYITLTPTMRRATMG